ncbi:MAG: PQQ-binding-like beta-propeller repeat protein [Sedimentisphaerales bacterium]|nr:PQQ-binding-like beta-propeller repeat protein [Sedimentisphaerales bacterium]
MRRKLQFKSSLWKLFVVCFLTGTVVAKTDDPARLARKISDVAGVKGGIVVHLGSGDGKLTVSLRADESFTVHGLETDPTNVAEARRFIHEQGLYGPVSVETFSGSILPYTDNLINLIVVEDAGSVQRDEIMRVLAPGGVACAEHNGQWKTIVKPWPDTIDQWTHFLHDASNNAVADDSVVGPPRSLQWVAPPLWLRSHETPSGIQSTVSANGRIFYFFDEGLIGITDERLPDRWALMCRDAFNGKLLWRKPLESWGWREWNPEKWQGKDWTTIRGGRTDVPNENQRRMVADGDRLYTTLAYRAPMSILNAVTGDIIATIEATRNVSEILACDGIVIAYTRNEPEEAARRRGIKNVTDGSLVAVDGQTAEILWQKQVGQIRPLALAMNNGRIIYLSGKNLVARNLKNGEELWKIQPKQTSPQTLLTIYDTIVMQGGKFVAAYDASDGRLLWDKTVPPIGGGEGDDLFVIDGLVWRGILSVDDEGKPARKSPHALVIGWDLRTGEEKKRILVKDLRSPEHHHRCYRNKATLRYLISSYEGAEFLDFQADDHSQNNWIRGACKYGMIPCNGMLYVPPDQCFCQPGAKLLGYTALTSGDNVPLKEVPDQNRLEEGPAYGKISNLKSQISNANDWPTLRHDPSRSGTTKTNVAPAVSIAWKTKLKGELTQPIASNSKVFVAKPNAHTIYALNAVDGTTLWHFTADGRIDSPPTIHKGMVLFGSKDGYVYCLRASDGALAWRFLAAPLDRRVAFYDQIESAWPVHGSVLVHDGTVYFTAGRSTYLDGGIRVYGLDPISGTIRYQSVLKGPNPFAEGERDVAFFVLGANSDVLVSEGGFLYMRQKKLTPELKEIKAPVLSSKGAQDVGMHIFSTSGLLDGSWYNRTFWMYSKRWPGFQLANQASKTGQLLVVDESKTYAVRVFYRRNVHSTMFFPGKEGYLLFADLNTNEPQLVGEPDWRKPLAWLPQSHIPREGNPGLDDVSRGFGADKGIGYTRAEPPVWMEWYPVRIRAMVKAGETLFAAGPPDVLDPKDPYAAFEGRKGAKVLSISPETGKMISEIDIASPPVFDGLIAASGRLFAALEDGSVICMAEKSDQ